MNLFSSLFGVFKRRVSQLGHTAQRAACLLVPLLLAALPLRADLESNFEDGGLGPWWAFGPNSVTNTSAAANGGTRSVLVSNRTDSWQGIGTDIRTATTANTTYTLTAWVKMKEGEAAAGLKFTLQRTPTGGSTTFTDIFDFVNVTDATWVKVSGTFSYPTASNQDLNLYMQCASPTASFYIDDISIKAVGAPSFNFDDGSTQGWYGFGWGVTAVNDTVTKHSGAGSLFVSNRTESWQGPAVDLRGRLTQGKTYAIKAYVRLAAGTPAQTVNFFMQRQPAGGATQYDQVTQPVMVNDSMWTLVSGNYKLLTGDNDILTFYLPAQTSTASYWLDTVSIEEVAPPQDNSGLYADFDDGTTQGWYDRGSSIQVVNTDFRSAGKSLAVTGRWDFWAGAAVNATGKFYKGSKYTVSAWVKLLPGQTSAPMHLSLQTLYNGQTSYTQITPNQLVTSSGWVNLTDTFVFNLDADEVQFYVESASGTSSFYLDDVLVMYVPIKPVQTDIPSLKTVLAPWFPRVGAAISPSQTTGLHADLIKKHYNMVTADNAMKWEAIQPAEGAFAFDGADEIANFARANGMKIHGHAFVWHSQYPDWLFKDTNGNPLVAGNAAHRDLVLKRLRAHIQALTARYNDVIDTWDVANEVVSDDTPAALRSSPWLSIVGPDYVEQAFRIAAEYAGSTKLAINEYDTDRPAKRDFLKSLVQDLKAKGVRIDVVAHQSHINNYRPTVAEFAASIDAFATLGVEQQISEFDMSVYPNFNDTVIPENALAIQGYRYRDLFTMFRTKSASIRSVTFWGLADDTSWLKYLFNRDDKPLPFDEELQAKPAYWGIVDPTKLPVIPKATRGFQGLTTLAAGVVPEAAPLLGTPLDGGVAPKFTASFKTLWQTNALWVEVNVTTASRRGTDTVDLFVDENNDKGTSTADDHIHSFTGLGASTSNGANGVITLTPTGYRLNALLPITRNLSAGAKIGFDVRIRTRTSGNIRQSWSNTRHDQETNPAAIGTLTLGAPRRIATAASGTPVIDGNLDTVWSKAKTVTTNQYQFGTGATATVRTLWGNGRLYVYAVVTDPLLSDSPVNPWEQDSFEVFIDENNSQGTPYDADDAQYRINFKNVRSFNGAAALPKIASVTKLTPTGYIVEASFAVDPARTKAGNYLGFDFQVNDTNGSGARTSVATFNDTVGTAYMDASQFGAILLEK
ncbi:endo-1,4-beta-xylanase [Nibricoccus sp. IMCC34717]|uniref:endo-1,4-beta-xylanase n=1 Tax=Nibricoccus sp. IMCC34717 TaxID=3034021 RepID=UPI0038501229